MEAKQATYILVAITVFSLVFTASALVRGGEYTDLTPTTLADILGEAVQKKGLSDIGAMPSSVRVLPYYPHATLSVVNVLTVNETPVIFVDKIVISEKHKVYYAGDSRRDIADVIRAALTDGYDQALYNFYPVLAVAREGVPVNYYDEIKVPGIKELSIPEKFTEMVQMVKPVLLAVVIGVVDENLTGIYGPITIYYVAVETRCVLENGLLSKALIVYAIVHDPEGLIYGREYVVGLSAYTFIGAGGFSEFTLFLYSLAVYGILGLSATGAGATIKPDELDKFSALTATFFIVQTISLFIILRVLGVPFSLMAQASVILGPWLNLLSLLWLPSYFTIAYYYGYSGARYELDKGENITGVLSRISITAIAFLLMMLLLIFPRQFLETLVSFMGINGLFLYMLILSGVIALIGIEIGIMYARVQRVRKEFTRII